MPDSKPSAEHEAVDPQADRSHRVKYPLQLSLLALGLGVIFEILMDGHPLGISFPMWAALSVAILLISSVLEGVTPSLPELGFGAAIVVFSSLSVIRAEELTRSLNVLGTLLLFTLWVRTFRFGRIIDFGWLDFALTFVVVPLEAWFRPWPVVSAAWQGAVGERRTRSTAFAVLRGLLLALPALIVLTALLVSADLVFADYVERALRWLDLETLARWAENALVIVLSALFFLGALVIALREPRHFKLVGYDKPTLRPFLGFTEALVILALVDLLFLLFVLVQFAYLFGGEANITAAGYTYSEYAVRGFSELNMVAFLSLGLILALGTWSKADQPQRIWLNGASTALVLMVGIMLVSSLKRLLLYESVYGFTRLRTYSHVAIPWMGVMFAVFLVLLWRNHLRRLAPAAMFAVMGFTLTLNVLNIDAFVVRQNVARYRATGDLDQSYLLMLSDDAIPAMLAFADEEPEVSREYILPQLACRKAMLEDQASRLEWPSYHRARASALKLLNESELLAEYRVLDLERGPVVVGPGGEQVCDYAWRWD